MAAHDVVDSLYFTGALKSEFHPEDLFTPKGIKTSPPSSYTTRDAIADTCDQIKELLVRKNRAYGNSALVPTRCFSKANPVEQLLVRIDDKLSRISTRGFKPAQDEDTLCDLIGYLVLLLVALNPPRGITMDFALAATCDDLKDALLAQDFELPRQSAGCFSKASATDLLLVAIDARLSAIREHSAVPDEDTVRALAKELIFLKVSISQDPVAHVG